MLRLTAQLETPLSQLRLTEEEAEYIGTGLAKGFSRLSGDTHHAPCSLATDENETGTELQIWGLDRSRAWCKVRRVGGPSSSPPENCKIDDDWREQFDASFTTRVRSMLYIRMLSAQIEEFGWQSLGFKTIFEPGTYEIWGRSDVQREAIASRFSSSLITTFPEIPELILGEVKEEEGVDGGGADNSRTSM